MPYEAHPEFQAPAGDSKIWRYMNMSKFLSLLDNRCLHFVRLDKLLTQDPFEGSFTRANRAVLDLPYNAIPPEVWARKGIKDEKDYAMVIQAHKQSFTFQRMMHAVTFVNSWHVQGHESAAMWAQYLKHEEGIAIRSTFARLTQALQKYPDFQVYIGFIKYLDYDREAIAPGNILSAMMHKRKSFEHEHELRALIWTPQHGKNDPTDPSRNKFKDTSGLFVAVDVAHLIEEVYVAPTCASWVRDLVTSVCKRFDLAAPVIHSDLSTRPLF